MSYQFPPDVERLVNDRMIQGGYASQDDVLRDALRPRSWRRPVRAEFWRTLRQIAAGGLATVLVLAILTGLALVSQALYWLSLAGELELEGTKSNRDGMCCDRKNGSACTSCQVAPPSASTKQASPAIRSQRSSPRDAPFTPVATPAISAATPATPT